ncbi:WW domain-containing oxidoreductase-like, partial [Gigantopelta aegis]|uniref:WW domain-containing oxidoreductase-like n=1 Tax=Gigantopelta aegis TaxID=1735272 RepID=UPI001B88E6C6
NGAKLSFPVVDLSGKVAVVTGGNAGIGYETAKALAIMGSTYHYASRSSEKANALFRSTKDFSVAFREKNLPLHILINNAGISGVPLTMTEDGYESHFQVNYLSHFLLTLELLLLYWPQRQTVEIVELLLYHFSAHTDAVFEPGNMNAE